MKKIFISCLAISIASVAFFISCKKDKDNSSSLLPPRPINKPPVANAGPDIIITQSSCAALHWTKLIGSGSFDPDGKIAYYKWKKISGPLEGILSDTDDDTAIAIDLRSGLYSFELLVQDSGGIISRDTMFVDITNWSMPEYDLDITINGTYNFYDNLQDDYGDYEDLTIIHGTGNFTPIGEFTLHIYESADTATLGNSSTTSFLLSTAGENTSSNIPFISGQCFVFFKGLIQDGGGTFTGTFKVQGGTARACNPEAYQNLPSLTITGSMDTTLHTVSITIKGKIYF